MSRGMFWAVVVFALVGSVVYSSHAQLKRERVPHQVSAQMQFLRMAR